MKASAKIGAGLLNLRYYASDRKKCCANLIYGT